MEDGEKWFLKYTQKFFNFRFLIFNFSPVTYERGLEVTKDTRNQHAISAFPPKLLNKKLILVNHVSPFVYY